MYGHNFQVCLGIDIFNGEGTSDFVHAFKTKYPNSNPDQYSLSPLNKEELFNDIIDKLNFRGDKGAGLTLTRKKELKLKTLQQAYIDYIRQLINKQTTYFAYPYLDGLPGYSVFWDYCYVLFTDNHKIVLVYGSSSD